MLAYLAVIKHFRDQLVHLQEQITSLEEGLGVTSANSANYSAAQTRWNGMVNAIDPRRYPLVQLNWISQVMPADGVILTNFESKISEVKIQGDANSAISWRTSISIRI